MGVFSLVYIFGGFLSTQDKLNNLSLFLLLLFCLFVFSLSNPYLDRNLPHIFKAGICAGAHPFMDVLCKVGDVAMAGDTLSAQRTPQSRTVP